MTKLAYILSASHSGSTLLSMLLGTHPQIATVGEMKLPSEAMGDLRRYRCSCGEFISTCTFWQKVTELMAARGLGFDVGHAGTDHRTVASRYARRLLSPMCRGPFLESIRDLALAVSPTWRKQLPEIQRQNASLASTVSEIAGAQVVVDSSKTAVRLKYLLRNPQLDVKVIRLIRDGRAVALTYMDPANFADAKEEARRGGGMGGDRANERLSMAQAAYEWRRSIEEGGCILRRLAKSQWTEVRYEDYCKDPDAQLTRLWRFLGVAPVGRPVELRRIGQHVVGNGMRLDTASEIHLDERWREKLTSQDLRVFDQIAGEINQKYGYV